MDLTREMTRRQAVMALGATALAACFSDRPDDGMGPDGEGTVIEMTNQLTFSPETVTIEVGGRVTWKNTSDVFHTATGDPDQAVDPANVRLPAGADPWDSGGITAGGEYSRTFDVPGEYRYFCIPHEQAGMVGTVFVGS
jgi:plastocyanin